MPEVVRISFLGGLGEIGRNCAVVEQAGRLVVLDCGVMFPNPEMPGVDLVLPDFTFLRERAEDVDGIVLTHGTRTMSERSLISCVTSMPRSMARP